MDNGPGPLVLFARGEVTRIEGVSGPITYDLNTDIDIPAVRDEFNGLIANLSEQHDALAWNLLRIVERNTLVHALFAEVCMLALITRLGDQVARVHTGSWFVYEALLARGFSTRAVNRASARLHYLLKCLAAWKGTFGFALSQWQRSLQYKAVKRSELPNHLDDLIITWASEGNITDNTYQEGYFGDLPAFLTARGRRVMTLVLPYNLEASRLFPLRANSNRVIVLEDLLEAGDWWRILKLEVAKHRFRLGGFVFRGENLTTLVRSWQRLEHANISACLALAVPRLNKFGIKVLYHHFENMISERVIDLMAKQSLVGTFRIGYFHTSKPDNLLCLEFCNPSDATAASAPDRVVFNADAYRRHYQARFPDLDCVNGYAFKQRRIASGFTERATALLVLLPGVQADCDHLLDALVGAGPGPCPVHVRAHPMLATDWETRYSGSGWQGDSTLASLPTHAVSAYSGALLEYAAMGVRVGLVYDPRKPLLNPCDGTGFECSLIGDAKAMADFLKQPPVDQGPKPFFNLEPADYEGFLL